jgi:hypothetical protein
VTKDDQKPIKTQSDELKPIPRPAATIPKEADVPPAAKDDRKPVKPDDAAKSVPKAPESKPPKPEPDTNPKVIVPAEPAKPSSASDQPRPEVPIAKPQAVKPPESRVDHDAIVAKAAIPRSKSPPPVSPRLPPLAKSGFQPVPIPDDELVNELPEGDDVRNSHSPREDRDAPEEEDELDDASHPPGPETFPDVLKLVALPVFMPKSLEASHIALAFEIADSILGETLAEILDM